MNFHRIKNIVALKNYQLKVEFITGELKIYDCKPLLEKDVFKALENENLFRKVKVDIGGYGIIWSDEIDLSESELWINGKTVESQVAEDKAYYNSK